MSVGWKAKTQDKRELHVRTVTEAHNSARERASTAIDQVLYVDHGNGHRVRITRAAMFEMSTAGCHSLSKYLWYLLGINCVNFDSVLRVVVP